MPRENPALIGMDVGLRCAHPNLCGLTKVIVAHRPETIASADRVLVMESGRIVRELRPQAQGMEPPATAAA